MYGSRLGAVLNVCKRQKRILARLSTDVRIEGTLKWFTLRDGASLCAKVYGPEKVNHTLLLINGWTLGKCDWHPDFFTRSDVNVVALDNRGKSLFVDFLVLTYKEYAGVGHSSISGVPYSIDMLAEDVCEVLQGLGSAPVHLLGTSMGGMIGMCRFGVPVFEMR